MISGIKSQLSFDLQASDMGSCFSSPDAPSPPSCSPEERDSLEWKISLQQHKINQLKLRLKRWETENIVTKQGPGDIGSATSKSALTGIADRYGQTGADRDTRQILWDLAVLNYYQRHVLDALACVPERRVPRVHFK